MVRVHITGLHDFSPTELSVLEELHAAKLEELHAARARYMRPNPNAAVAARLADSGTGPTPRFSGVDAGNPRPEKPALSLDRAQLTALRAFRSGLSGCEYPRIVFRRLFDLERLGLVERQDGVYWITNSGLTALRSQ